MKKKVASWGLYVTKQFIYLFIHLFIYKSNHTPSGKMNVGGQISLSCHMILFVTLLYIMSWANEPKLILLQWTAASNYNNCCRQEHIMLSFLFQNEATYKTRVCMIYSCSYVQCMCTSKFHILTCNLFQWKYVLLLRLCPPICDN